MFQRSNFYAVAGFGGAFVFAAMAFAKAPLVLAAAACVFTVVFLRYLSVYYDWKTSDEADLTPKVARGARTAKHFCAELFRRATLHRKKEPPPAPRGFAIERISLCNPAFSSCTPGAPSA